MHKYVKMYTQWRIFFLFRDNSASYIQFFKNHGINGVPTQQSFGNLLYLYISHFWVFGRS